MKYFLLYLLLLNAGSFLIMLIDKKKAQKNLWRIPEKTLFSLALLGGSLGIWGGMYAFRHKTRHMKFVIGIPAIMLLELAAGIWFSLQFLP